ncbi:MAG: sensor histidine kinase [Minwuia sp.]|uniref:sensor histidine kinase n=1 Tax=Minwuia sp. TaxID=2493630 RepID=UPI003A8515CD
MYLYRAVNKFVLSRSYLGKILLISFLGVHVPIIGAVTYILLSSGRGVMENIDIVLAMLVATLVGTAATLIIHHGLLAPVRMAAKALNAYLQDRAVPSLPTKYGDEAGVLMANVQESITRLDAALDALRAEKEDDAKHFRGKLELLSSMSHELRTPLNHIIGFAEMMSNEVMGPLGGEKYKDYASNIGRSGGDLMETVKVLTEIGAAEVDGGLDLQPVAVGETVDQAIGLMHFRAEQRGVMVARGPVDVDLRAAADPRAFKQALGHTLQAAIATSETGALCRVDCREDAGWAVLTVTADRKGWVLDDVPPELRHDALGAAAYSEANSEGGIASVSPTAVHLSLVSTLMRANRGSLHLENRSGQRIFMLKLPLAGVALQTAASAEAAA